MSDEFLQASNAARVANESLPLDRRLKITVTTVEEETAKVLFQVEARDHLDELNEILDKGHRVSDRVYRYLKCNSKLYTMNECHTTPETISKDTGMGVKSVYAAIYHLKSHDVIRRSKIGLYYINPRYFTVFGTKDITQARKKWNEKGVSNE